MASRLQGKDCGTAMYKATTKQQPAKLSCLGQSWSFG